jgi:acid phosphatase type 7
MIALGLSVFAMLMPGSAASPAPSPGASRSTTVVAAGDIASCDQTADEETAELVRRLDPDAILTTGDNVYPSGSRDEFGECYSPGWGQFLSSTFPSPGNHDYDTPNAAGYFSYFGARAPGPYYSFDLGGWHFVSLNTEIDRSAGSPQIRWLRRDLRRDDHRCELLYWHRPRWSGGSHGSSRSADDLWRAAYEGGVDIVLTGHDHNYQRFRRLGAQGRPDRRFGVVQIVVGTGGRSHYDPGSIVHRVVADGTTFGVLELGLRPRSFALRFVPVAGGSFTDAVRHGACHRAPARKPR